MNDARTSPFFDAKATARQVALVVLVVAALATIALLVIVFARPDQATTALRAWVLAVGATAIASATRVGANRYPIHGRTSFDFALQRHAAPTQRIARLRQVESQVMAASWDRREYGARLQPALRAVAAQRLATYCNIDIDAEPGLARTVLSERTWSLLTKPIDTRERDGPGITLDDLRSVVDALEKLDGNNHGQL